MKKFFADISFRFMVVMLHALALLPLKVLYLFADAIYFLIYYVIGYRKKLVRQNLAQSFPEYTPAHRLEIEKRFYRNFSDYIIETIKLLHITDKEILKRMEFENLDIITGLMDNGKSVVAYFAHTGNWEWAPSITLHCAPQLASGDVFAQVYRPLRNERFDRLMLKIRSRFGSMSIAKKVTLRTLLSLRRDNIVSITGFMSDQKPSHGDQTHIINFMGRPTAVITGTETLGRRLGMAAVYWDMSKPRRGHYKISVRLITDDMSSIEPMSATDTYFAMLEQTVRRDPSIWLWSHNRWKHTSQPTESNHNLS